MKHIISFFKAIGIAIQDALARAILRGYAKRVGTKAEALHKQNQEKMNELEKRADSLLKRIDEHNSSANNDDADKRSSGSGNLQ